MDDADEDIDTAQIEEEDWFDYIKRSTKKAEEQMKAANVPCWIEAQRKMKWIVAVRIASHPETRWTKKAAKWNPGLSIRAEAYRAVGRPTKRGGKTTLINSSSQVKQKREMETTYKKTKRMERNGKRPCQKKQ